MNSLEKALTASMSSPIEPVVSITKTTSMLPLPLPTEPEVPKVPNGISTFAHSSWPVGFGW